MISKDSVLDYRYHMFYEKTSLSFYNQSHYLNDYELRVRQLKKYSNVIRIDITNEDYRLNNQIFNENSLKSEIKRLIQSNADYAVTFNYPEDLSFGKYFGALSAIRGAIRVFRDAESFRLAKKDFDQLRSSFNSSDLEMEIMNKYPLRLLDLSPDLKQMNQAPPNFSPLLKELDEE